MTESEATVAKQHIIGHFIHRLVEFEHIKPPIAYATGQDYANAFFKWMGEVDRATIQPTKPLPSM